MLRTALQQRSHRLVLEEAGRRELHLRGDRIPDRHLESDAVPCSDVDALGHSTLLPLVVQNGQWC
jgi:hypothetical protein